MVLAGRDEIVMLKASPHSASKWPLKFTLISLNFTGQAIMFISFDK